LAHSGGDLETDAFRVLSAPSCSNKSSKNENLLATGFKSILQISNNHLNILSVYQDMNKNAILNLIIKITFLRPIYVNSKFLQTSHAEQKHYHKKKIIFLL